MYGSNWKRPYWNKPSDVLVLMAIVNGELPKMPTEEQSPNLLKFNFLWDLCQLCWTNGELRPTAQQIWDRLLLETDAFMASSTKEISLPNEPFAPADSAQVVRHRQSFQGASTAGLWPDGHHCAAMLVDSKMCFSCRPGTWTSLILSAQLDYTVKSFSYPFEFRLVAAQRGLAHQFSVSSVDEVSWWHRAFTSNGIVFK